jgi:tryptophan-rich sensory protein
MESFKWYAQLKKPFFAPPSSLFGPVWSVLYVIIFATFGYVFYLFFKKTIPFIVLLPFILNLVFNFAFTPLQFGLRNNYLALLDIILVLITIIWCMYVIYPYSKYVALLQIPYLIWVSFATILQISITYLNR